MAKLTIGTLVDRYDNADLDVKKAEAALSAAKKIREALSNQLQDRFSKDDLKGATGKTGGAKLSLVLNSSPTITDRAALDEYVRRKKAFELMQGRVNKAAWLERMEADGKPIPGVQTFEKYSLRLTRSK